MSNTISATVSASDTITAVINLNVDTILDAINGEVVLTDTTSDKLQAIADSKAVIKAALTAQGRSPSDVLSSYGDAVLSIPNYEIDPYKGLRPSDWMKMPDTVGENEIYLLFHLANTDENFIAFSVACTGNYTVALGTVVNGAFAEVTSSTLASGATYENAIDYSAWGDTTSKGFRQVMIKVAGTDIIYLYREAHSKKPSPSSFKRWNIVEIAARLPSATDFQCGSSAAYSSLNNLCFFALYGTNQITNASNMFRGCSSLRGVIELDTTNVIYMGSMFYTCYSLVFIPAFNTPNLLNTSSMFRGCSAIQTIPLFDMSHVTNASYMFYTCYGIAALPNFNTMSCEDMSNMFQLCTSLVTLPTLNTSSATILTNTFASCYSLATLLLVPTATWTTPQAISIADASLSHQAIVALFNSLPTIGTAKAITLTGNPGVGELTAGDQAIATGKGWTLVL